VLEELTCRRARRYAADKRPVGHAETSHRHPFPETPLTPSREDTSDPSAADADVALALVCTLAPLGRESRRVSVRSVLERATGWAEHEDGVLLEFPGGEEIVRTLLDFVLAERRCCPHFTYELCFVPDHERVTLRMRASGDYRAPLKALYRELAREAGIHDQA
jgi:hypothetical protein